MRGRGRGLRGGRGRAGRARAAVVRTKGEKKRGRASSAGQGLMPAKVGFVCSCWGVDVKVAQVGLFSCLVAKAHYGLWVFKLYRTVKQIHVQV